MHYFAFSDIHGDLIGFNMIKDWLNSHYPNNWRCYFLGDAIDRGTDGYQIMNEILSDDRFIYIKGNHEDLFVKAAQECIDVNIYKKNFPYNGPNGYLHYQNGGLPTIKDWVAAGAPKGIIKQINNLPYYASYKNIDLIHAEISVSDFEDFQKNPNDIDLQQQMIWARYHFYEDWRDGHILIHGHTPIQILLFHRHLPLEKIEPINYANDTKWDIDTGVFTSKQIYIFDLDELQPIYIGASM